MFLLYQDKSDLRPERTKVRRTEALPEDLPRSESAEEKDNGNRPQSYKDAYVCAAPVRGACGRAATPPARDRLAAGSLRDNIG